ncbi:MAG: hypothetical protein INH41_07100 [Myxococcaceae bacterium]|nr:hypothetical protein [Myxococcaceae bacterium]MCA3012152.1 hypothetical protein [Myxococcaceae bacterium]
MRVAKRLSVMGLLLVVAAAAWESSRGADAPAPTAPPEAPREEHPTGRPPSGWLLDPAASRRSLGRAATAGGAPAANRTPTAVAAEGQEQLVVGDLDEAPAEDLLATERPATGPRPPDTP